MLVEGRVLDRKAQRRRLAEGGGKKAVSTAQRQGMHVYALGFVVFAHHGQVRVVLVANHLAASEAPHRDDPV